MKHIWIFIHNAIVHPMMGLSSLTPNWVYRFHDYTAAKAYSTKDLTTEGDNK